MNTITVKASREYRVLVGSELIDQLGIEISKISKATKIAIISDSNVWPLYGEKVINSLQKTDYDSIVHYTFPAGEMSKNGETFLDILEFLAKNQITRSDCLIALGGGVVGDITGFAAASFLRGVDYVQVPTTLLACVDSSVGGKTAIDLKAGKNLVGAFYQPKLVLCDIDTLNTLPEEIFRDGCAEVIKYGVLYDPELFAHLRDNGLNFDRKWVITRCIELKRNVVAQDEFDTGARQKLNLGHTIGHGVEANSNFTISHGKAVAVGMAIVCRAGVNYGICAESDSDRIISVIRAFGLPVHTEYGADMIYTSALNDKKRSGGTVNLIIPQCIGDCTFYPIAVDRLKAFIKAGL